MYVAKRHKGKLIMERSIFILPRLPDRPGQRTVQEDPVELAEFFEIGGLRGAVLLPQEDLPFQDPTEPVISLF